MTEKHKKNQLEQYKKEKDEYLKGWKRSRAEFLNYKKEEGQRIAKAAQEEREEIIKELISVLDDIYLAEKEIPSEENSWAEGVLGVKKQIEAFFKRMGVEEIISEGEKFDPYFHEAVEVVEDEAEEPDTVIEEIKKGYKLKDKIIRPAKVRVAKGQ